MEVICLEEPLPEDCAGPPSLRAEAFGRLIQIYFRDVARPKADDSFARRRRGSLRREARRQRRKSFCDRFHDFAKAYFLLARRHADLFQIRRAEFRGAPVEMLAQVLSAAVASEQIGPLAGSARTAAAWIGTNLVTLQQQVGTDRNDEALTPDEAADLLTTVLFEGLQA